MVAGDSVMHYRTDLIIFDWCYFIVIVVIKAKGLVMKIILQSFDEIIFVLVEERRQIRCIKDIGGCGNHPQLLINLIKN